MFATESLHLILLTQLNYTVLASVPARSAHLMDDRWAVTLH